MSDAIPLLYQSGYLTIKNYNRIFGQYNLLSGLLLHEPHIQTQVKTCRARADMVMYTANAIYVFELKINKFAQEALSQIDEKGYMIPYTSDGRKLVKCGISFSTKTRTIEDWIIKEEN